MRANVAVYQPSDKSFTLTIKFAPKTCTVTCTNTNYYGGMNVDPNGLYKKTDSHTPAEKDLTP